MGILLRMTLSMRQYLPALLLALLVLVCAASLAVLFSSNDRNGKLTVAFLDVGQGDAIFIESPTGTQVVVDGGPDSSVVRELSGVMPLWDRSLDAIIVTNPDQDHFAGFLDVLKRYDVAREFESGTAKDSPMYNALVKAVESEGVSRTFPKRSETIDLGGGAYLKVLFPDRDVTALDSNPGSIIMQLVYGDTRVMLMGDTVVPVEDFVTALDGEKLKSQILKLGHHGSRTSSGEKLLAMVDPDVAIVSAGCDNSYGHPHKEVLERLAAHKIPYLWTCKEGTIEFSSDGKVWSKR